MQVFEAPDAEHGRVETRRHRVTHSVDWLSGDRAEPGARPMPGLATLACVEAARDGGAPSTRYYLSSARLTPERFARAVGSHWAIESANAQMVRCLRQNRHRPSDSPGKIRATA